MARVIINEQHSLLPEQEKILNTMFSSWDFFKVPADGWTLSEQKEIAKSLAKDNVVFCSPVPLLLAELAKNAGFMDACSRVENGFSGQVPSVYVFHNDVREKKELPNGKTISVTAKEGWQLVEI
jgi:hypothetical protein